MKLVSYLLELVENVSGRYLPIFWKSDPFSLKGVLFCGKFIHFGFYESITECRFTMKLGYSFGMGISCSGPRERFRRDVRMRLAGVLSRADFPHDFFALMSPTTTLMPGGWLNRATARCRGCREVSRQIFFIKLCGSKKIIENFRRILSESPFSTVVGSERPFLEAPF